jgi:hypothetical protein
MKPPFELPVSAHQAEKRLNKSIRLETDRRCPFRGPGAFCYALHAVFGTESAAVNTTRTTRDVRECAPSVREPLRERSMVVTNGTFLVETAVYAFSRMSESSRAPAIATGTASHMRTRVPLVGRVREPGRRFRPPFGPGGTIPLRGMSLARPVSARWTISNQFRLGSPRT